MLTAGLTAQRFAGKPLKQPNYAFRDIPRCNRDLSGSELQEVTERDHFTDAMSEMVLLCNDVMRRQTVADLEKNTTSSSASSSTSRNAKKRASKPLSLEYIADRMDVDDPLSGFFVRTAVPPENANEKWKPDMLQGFITVTTFTNWQKTFRWDSMNDAAFSYDEPDLSLQMSNGERKVDHDGKLSEELQATARCGDPWNEGIVWPRIAEISLLGSLGCGKTLLSLVIEKLECTPPSSKRNYDYIVLQATDNSIPFYESMGFVRVGCITENEDFDDKNNLSTVGSDDTPVAVPVEESDAVTDDSAVAVAVDQIPESEAQIVSSEHDVYVTKKAWQSPLEVAKELDVDVWDIVFLNAFVYPDILPRSRLHKDTTIFVPSKRAKEIAVSNALRNLEAGGKSSAVQWYFSEDDETPKAIANKFNVPVRDIVKGNKERISDLQPFSRLIEGTRIKVSHLDVHDDKHVPYCHWTFPDDTLESSEPSYMMAYRLNRKRGAQAKLRPFEASLAVPISKYIPKKGQYKEADPSKGNIAFSGAALSKVKKVSKKAKRHPDEPVPPKKPMTGYFFYMCAMREVLKKEMGCKMTEISKAIGEQWKHATDEEKAIYKEKADVAKAGYQIDLQEYKSKMEAFRTANPGWVSESDTVVDEHAAVSGSAKGSQHLFNKVVKLTKGGVDEFGTEFKYFYVLTYLPDLQWCHLAPMRKVGIWGPSQRKCEGRPKWMLVDENEGKEVDISASYCEIVRSRAIKRTEDADEEQWDIMESGPPSAFQNILQPLDSLAYIGTKQNEKIGASIAAPFTNRASDGIQGARVSVPIYQPPPRKEGMQAAEANAPERRGRPPKDKNRIKETGASIPKQLQEPHTNLNTRKHADVSVPKRRGRPPKNKIKIQPEEGMISNSSEGNDRSPRASVPNSPIESKENSVGKEMVVANVIKARRRAPIKSGMKRKSSRNLSTKSDSKSGGPSGLLKESTAVTCVDPRQKVSESIAISQSGVKSKTITSFFLKPSTANQNLKRKREDSTSSTSKLDNQMTNPLELVRRRSSPRVTISVNYPS